MQFSRLLFLLLALYLLPPLFLQVAPGSLHCWENDRHLIALSKGSGKIFLSWRFLISDSPDSKFNIYRADNIDGPYSILPEGEEHDYTNFVDETANNNSTYYYLVKPVLGGVEGESSNRVQSTSNGKNSGLVLEILGVASDLDPVGPGVGDLNGDGFIDYVVLDNNFYEDDNNQSPILRAYLHDGTFFWSFDTKYQFRDEAPGIVLPFVVWDLDGDEKSEVITRMGKIDDSRTFLTILKADMAGTPTIIDSVSFPTALPGSAPNLRPHYLSVAYLDGPSDLPSIITQVAVHHDERVTAFDLNNQLQMNQRWDYQSDDASGTSGSGTHGIPVYDIDQDGEEEVFDGSTVLDGDGRVIWTLHSREGQRVKHPDAVIPGEINVSNPGPEVWFITEGDPQGVYLTDFRGDVLWQETNWLHGHDGWAADLIPNIQGAELYGFDVFDPTIDRHNRVRIFSARGQVLFRQINANQDRYHHLIQWDADNEKELLHKDSGYIFNADGTISGYLPDVPRFYNLQMDVVGDFREEFLILNPDYNWMKIYTNIDSINRKRLSNLEDPNYRKDASRVSASYWRYYSP